MKYIAFILIALAVTAADVAIAIAGIMALILNGNAQSVAGEFYVLIGYFYGFPAGCLALISLLFLPLYELKHSRIIGWWLFIAGLIPMAVFFIHFALMRF